MDALDLGIRQAVVLHHPYQVEIILSQLPRFQICWTVFFLVLEVH